MPSAGSFLGLLENSLRIDHPTLSMGAHRGHGRECNSDEFNVPRATILASGRRRCRDADSTADRAGASLYHAGVANCDQGSAGSGSDIFGSLKVNGLSEGSGNTTISLLFRENPAGRGRQDRNDLVVRSIPDGYFSISGCLPGQLFPPQLSMRR